MSLGRFFALAALAFAITASPGWAASPIAPSADSSALLKLRNAPEDELRFTFRKEADGEPTETISVGLARDYDYVDARGSRLIHDYRLRRVLTTLPDRRFIDNSLFAEVWFRTAELENRARFMRGVAQAGHIDPATSPTSFDPFWIESEMGMVHPALPRPDLRRVEDGVGVKWLLKDEEIASARFKAEPIPDEVRPGLRRLWITLVRLHPEIVDGLSANGHLPEHLSVKLVSKDHKTFETWHWTLTSVAWVTSAQYPLAAGLEAAPAETNGVYPKIFATLAEDVAQGRKPPPEDVYIHRAEAAIARGAGLEAFLWIIEMQLAIGTPTPACAPNDAAAYCRLLAKVGPMANADSRTAVAFGKEAPDEADRHKFDDLPNAYLLGVLFATRPHQPGAIAADDERGLLAGLQKSPVANFCKDTGDFYIHQWNPFAAWQAWDFGRLMAGHRAGDLLDNVDALEAQMLQRAPMFF